MMDEMTKLVLFVWALPRDPAGLAMRPPQFWIDTAYGVDRRDKDVGDFSIAFGMIALTCASTMRICRN